MKNILILLFIMFNFNAYAEQQTTPAETNIKFPTTSDLWLRAAPHTARMLAAYVSIDNQTDQALTLVGAYAPDFGMTEIHKTIEVDGMLKMREQESIALPQQSQITMQPGGLHIMLMMPKTSFKEGDEARICLIYQDEAGNEHVQHLDFPVKKK